MRRIVLENRCERTWASMTGDGRVRFCDGCGKNVYNWSVMTEEEREKVRGKVCWLLPVNVVR